MRSSGPALGRKETGKGSFHLFCGVDGLGATLANTEKLGSREEFPLAFVALAWGAGRAFPRLGLVVWEGGEEMAKVR